eukprot:11157482-Lingulodinium_polyedra.AAC.1
MSGVVREYAPYNCNNYHGWLLVDGIPIEKLDGIRLRFDIVSAAYGLKQARGSTYVKRVIPLPCAPGA